MFNTLIAVNEGFVQLHGDVGILSSVEEWLPEVPNLKVLRKFAR